MLTVKIEVNGVPVEIIDVVNRGPVGGVYAPGDYAGGDGARVYSWEVRQPSSVVWRRQREHGELVHVRGDGAAMLAAEALYRVLLGRGVVQE